VSVKVDNAAPATPITVGTNPSDVVVSGNHAYVANAGSNTVSVIDTGTKQVVATIPVGTGPNSLVATPQPNRVYVANSAYMTDAGGSLTVATMGTPNSRRDAGS
jgi:YVTN family beta-propeller protein